MPVITRSQAKLVTSQKSQIYIPLRQHRIKYLKDRLPNFCKGFIDSLDTDEIMKTFLFLDNNCPFEKKELNRIKFLEKYMSNISICEFDKDDEEEFKYILDVLCPLSTYFEWESAKYWLENPWQVDLA